MWNVAMKVSISGEGVRLGESVLLLICAFNTARMCLTSTQITGGTASTEDGGTATGQPIN